MHLKMDTNYIHFDQKKIEKILSVENKYIIDLFSSLPIPVSAQKQDSDDETEEVKAENGEAKDLIFPKKTARAKSLQELQKRLENMTQNKKKLSYKDKLLKKGIKNRIKKKSKQDERNAQQKLKRAAKLTNGTIKTEENTEQNEGNQQSEQPKPVFNKDGKMVFSKIDFANLGKKKQKKPKKDAKQLLQELREEKEKLKKLEAEGQVEKVVQIKEKTAWKNAIAKTQGEKVKDDPDLLKKTVKRQEQKVRSSQKKWKARLEQVQRGKDERQKKRQENIDKRKKDKKVHKMKKAVKKGKIIPGF